MSKQGDMGNKKVFGAFPVRFARRDGKDGDDGFNAVVAILSIMNMAVDCDSAGKPLASVSTYGTVSMKREGETSYASDVTIQKINGVSVGANEGRTVNNITVKRNSSYAYRYNISIGTSYAIASTTFTLTVSSASLGTTMDLEVVFIAAKQGAQGIQGIQGQMPRRRGKYTSSTLSSTTETFYNNDSWCDWIIFGNYKYRLADNILSWTKTTITKKDGTTVSGNYQPSGTSSDTTYWKVFSEFKDAAFNFLIANGFDVSQASICEAFIGTSGATLNNDGSISVSNTANGWAITGGQIRHTKTGLTLTSDGYLNDPNGLHLKVGGDASNSLMQPNGNMIKDCIFAGKMPFNGTNSANNGMTVDLAKVKHSGTPSSQFDFYSPWDGEGGCLVYLGVRANPNNETKPLYGVIDYDVVDRIQLVEGYKYTFSVWVAGTNLSTYIVTEQVAELNFYNAATGDTRHSNHPVLSMENKVGQVGDFSQYAVTVTVPTGYPWFCWIPLIRVLANKYNFYICYAGAKLEKGEVATGMGDVSKAGLLTTGIDITKGKIVNTADQWECQNNSGQKTAWLDEHGNWITTGVQNNLITHITSTNATEYILEEDGNFYLDVLRCGDFVWIDSLPSSMIGGAGAVDYKLIILPYYIKNGPEERGYTKFMTGVKHAMTSDEMRMLVGRRLNILVKGEYTYTFLTGVGDFKYYGAATNALRHITNNQRILDYNDVNWHDYSLVPRLLHIECCHAVLVDGNNNETVHNSYVWVGQSDYLALNDDGLDWD